MTCPDGNLTGNAALVIGLGIWAVVMIVIILKAGKR